MTYPEFKRLAFECPIGVEASTAPASAFETINGVRCLSLLCERGSYTPVKSYSSQPKLLRTFGSPIAKLSAYALEIEVRVTDQRVWLYHTMQRISRRCVVGRTKTPIRLFDFVLPETEDWELGVAAGTEPYTLRLACINEVKPGKGLIGQHDSSNAWMGEGFTLRLEDTQLRID